MSQTKAIDPLAAQKEQVIKAPEFLKKNALIQDYDSLYLYSISQPESFWGVLLMS